MIISYNDTNSVYFEATLLQGFLAAAKTAEKVFFLLFFSLLFYMHLLQRYI